MGVEECIGGVGYMSVIRERVYYLPSHKLSIFTRTDSESNSIQFDDVARYEHSIIRDLRNGMDVEIWPNATRWPWVNKPKKPRNADGYLIDEKEQQNKMDDQTTASIQELLDPNAPLTLPPGVVGKRVTESYNTEDAFICPNGQISYNLTDERRNELIAEGQTPPPIVYEGGRCDHCQEPVNRLETDVKTLQFRVSNFMRMAARLRAQQPGLLQSNSDLNEIGLFLRDAYAWEISQGEPQHSGNAGKAVIFYLQRERRRPTVVAGKVWRALLRMMGVR